jgi:ABC-type multidrug transport system ATPase subunit
MSEDVLKTILKLFAIVAKERITEDERLKIREFLSLHLNQEVVRKYLTLFDTFCIESRRAGDSLPEAVDEETRQFVDDWAQIMNITRQVNTALTMQQKCVLIIKIIELVHLGGELSERQSNLIFYIGEALRIPPKDFQAMRAFVVGQDIDELASKNILVIDEGSDTVAHPGPRIISKNLTGLIAILRLPESESYFIKYLGISNVTLNGLILKSRKIDVFPTGSTLRGNKMDPVYYSDVVGQFLDAGAGAEISLEAEHIFYHFKSGHPGLQNINLFETGGKLIGLMGASGSGKSTLLSVLNGSERPSSGRVLINGVDVHRQGAQLQGVIGYVPQSDLLNEELTVFENLYYAARLCFGNQTKPELADRVMSVLHSLGLGEIKDLKVGTVLQKTISGGQRRRLNIGLELLREPAVLFVDEPTSGLSSRDSENIMDLLKELALRGKLVFVVIHQPSSDIFKMFDTLVILDVGGFQIYYGNPVEAVNYFQEIINAANKTPGQCPECGNINPEQIFNIIETRVVNEYGRFTHTRKISPGQWYQYFKKKIRLPRIRPSTRPLAATQQLPTVWQQWRGFTARDVRSKLANSQYIAVNLLLAPVLAVFIAYFCKYYDALGAGAAQYTFYHNDNVPVYFFMSVVVALFIGLIVSAEEIFRDRKILQRERFLNLSRGAYLLSKAGILFGLSALQTLAFWMVGSLILEIPLTEFRYWLVLFSASCFANLLGLNISSAFDSAVTIYILIPLLIIPQLLLSGVVISFDRFNPRVANPKGVPWLAETMASRWAFEALMVTQFKDNPVGRLFFESDQRIAQAEYKRLYYLPTLTSKLEFALAHPADWKNSESDNPVGLELEVVRREIAKELSGIGTVHYADYDRLKPGTFDSLEYRKAVNFLSVLERMYRQRIAAATARRDTVLKRLAGTPDLQQRFNKARMTYLNEKVREMTENLLTPTRIVQWRGELVQKIYPIFNHEQRPSHLLDFRAEFYSPLKHFVGLYFDTLYFNLLVIWVMTLFLYVALYYAWLEKAVRALANWRKYRLLKNGR